MNIFNKMQIPINEVFQNLFIGRKEELFILEDRWNFILESGEHLAYSLLNTPGIGKTTLLNYFGEYLMKNKKGIMIKITASNNDTEYNRYVLNWINSINRAIIENLDLIREFIENNYKGDLLAYKIDDFEMVLKDLKIERKKRNFELNNGPLLIKELAEIIPVFFVIDEIQVWQQIEFINELGKKEIVLHCMARNVAELLNSKVLMIFSGTQYRILTQIGYEIGSPLRGKVEKILINLFSKEDVKNYVQKISERIKPYISKNFSENFSRIIKYFENFTLNYSGGHPRTLFKLTNRLISILPYLIEKEISYNELIEEFLSKEVISEFIPNLLSDIKKDIQKIQSLEGFNSIHNWIIANVINGLKLGKLKQYSENIVKIANYLVQFGILTINSENNYYITSYFHLVAYLNAIQDNYSIFLSEILQNRYFHQLCGSHSGFGYVFEEIILSVFLAKFKESNLISIKKSVLPFNSDKNYNIIISNKKIDWKSFIPENNTIYHFKQAKAIDYIIRDDEKIIFVQITSSLMYEQDEFSANLNIIIKKLKALIEIYKEIEKILKNRNPKFIIKGWLISLGEINFSKIKEKIEIPNWIKIDSGKDLEKILGKKLYQRIFNVKTNL